MGKNSLVLCSDWSICLWEIVIITLGFALASLIRR